MSRFLYTDKGVYILLILTAILWGANSVTAKYTVGELAPVTTAFLRFGAISIILCIIVWVSEGKKGLPTRKQIPGIVALGSSGVFLNNVLFYSGVQYTTAANASLLVGGGPIFTAVLSAIFLGERLTSRQLLGIAISFAGVGVVVSEGSWTVISGLNFNIGDLMMMAASVSWSVYSILGRHVMQGISALAATAWSSAIGTIWLFFAAIYQGFDGTVHLSILGWSSMIFMILGSGVLAFYWWNHGVSIIGPNKAAVFINVIPLSGMLFAALLLDEKLVWAQLVGAGLIITGVRLTTSSDRVALPAVEES